MLEGEVDLHLDAVAEVLEHFEGGVQLRQAIYECDVFVCLVLIAACAHDAIVVHELEVLVARLCLGIAL